MRKFITPYVVLVSAIIAYIGLVITFGYTESFGLAIHFSRTAVVMAVIIMFVPAMKYMFDTRHNTKSYRNRDFLLGGIILTELSNVSFSFWNEMYRIFGVDNNIFTSAISGFFSFLLILGGVSLLLASNVVETKRWVFALVVSVLAGVTLAFILPMFR